MKCSKCGADLAIGSTSSLCPVCLQTQHGRSRFNVLLIISIGVFLVFVIVIVLQSGTGKTATSDSPSSLTTAAPPASSAEPSPDVPAAAPAPEKHDWDYDTATMDAGSRPVKIGCIESDQMVHLNSPYEDTFARLCLRTDGAALFILNGDGQMLSGEGHGAIVRFGDGPAKRFSLEEPADYSSKEAFVEPAGPLFAAARAGKPITIEATYYEAGQQTVTFTAATPLNLK